jgi:hypothetical protein
MTVSGDYYEVLGVSRDAGAGTIKNAFRRLARDRGAAGHLRGHGPQVAAPVLRAGDHKLRTLGAATVPAH